MKFTLKPKELSYLRVSGSHYVGVDGWSGTLRTTPDHTTIVFHPDQFGRERRDDFHVNIVAYYRKHYTPAKLEWVPAPPK